MVAVIAAVSENGVIGNRGVIPWRIPGEQKRFRALTTGHTVVMGRRTYEEIGRPLPDRRNIVITSRGDIAGVETARSLAEAVAMADGDDVYLSGGARVYAEGLKYADALYLTRIHTVVEGDAFFPPFDPDAYELTEETRVEAEIPYTQYTYLRKTASTR